MGREGPKTGVGKADKKFFNSTLKDMKGHTPIFIVLGYEHTESQMLLRGNFSISHISVQHIPDKSAHVLPS